MVRIQSEIKRAILRGLCREAKATGATLREALGLYQDSALGKNVRNGRILINTSGSGQSASFKIPDASDQLTPEQVLALSEEYFSILDFAVANGAVDAPDPGGTLGILDALLTALFADDRLAGVRSVGLDVTLIGLPTMGSAPRG